MKKETNVLFVDDDLNLLYGIKRALRNEPYNVLFVNSAEKALKLLTTQEISVIVSDQRMPGINGIELLTMMRQKYPEIVRIMITGYASATTAVEAINRGEVFKFVPKPCEEDELKTILEEAILISKSKDNTAQAKDNERTALNLSLERSFPGITNLNTDKDGRIQIDE